METKAYPEIKEPETMPPIMPKMYPQQTPVYMPIEQPQNYELSVNWAQVFNWIAIVGCSVFLYAYGPYLADVQDLEVYKYIVFYEVVTIIVNVVWYFTKSSAVTSLLGILAYGSFLIFVLGVFVTILFINGSLADLVAVLVALLFLEIPLGLLGLSAWLALKESSVEPTSNSTSYDVNHTFDQETPVMKKVETKQEIRYIPVTLSQPINSQFIKIPQ